MKKIMLMAVFLLATVQGFSQEVFNRMYASATAVLNDPASNEAKTKLNYFFLTELNYLRSTAEQRMPEVTTTFLDTHAYYLSEFVTSFFQQVSAAHRVSAECQHGVVMSYVNATIENPLFGDTDKEKVHSFLHDPQYPTPFSLDTDWEKAYREATQKAAVLLNP